MFKAPYLEDKEFLKQFDTENHKIQFIRIQVLNFQEQVIANIEGKSTGGSINLSGTSNMRRNASCSLIVDPNGIKRQGYNKPQQYYNITEVENLISLNKKIKLETGFINTLANCGEGYYPEYDIIWFPLGTYVIKSANVSKNNSGINISLTLSDKCALLNGDMGGTIPAATVFSENELYNTQGETEVEKVLIKDIIKNLVVEFGGEKPDNVIVEDVPDTIVKVIKWSGKEPIYLDKREGMKSLRFEKPIQIEGESDDNYLAGWTEYQYGDNIGYMNEPFVYPGTLECNAGESVAAILDKIKNTLGNYEWFYDLDGKFHFQEIKNYLNTSLSTEILKEVEEQDYLSIANLSKSVYTFDEGNKILTTSISNNPQFQNIKNDYVVWGTKKTASGGQKPIRYHLAFDNKPDMNETEQRFGFIYYNTINVEQFVPLQLDKNCFIFPLKEGQTLNKNNYYLIQDWKDEGEKELVSEGLEYHLNSNGDGYTVIGRGDCEDTDIIIPSIYNGLSVTDIRYQAFKNDVNLESIVIPKNLLNISGGEGILSTSGAFYGCSNLEKIIFKNGLVEIGFNAFLDCDKLHTIIFSKEVQQIDLAIFQNMPQQYYHIYLNTLNLNSFKELTTDINFNTSTFYYIGTKDKWNTIINSTQITNNTTINELYCIDELAYPNTTHREQFKWSVYQYNMANNFLEPVPNAEVCYLETTDWRTELYFQGLEQSDKVFSQKPYSAELNSEWTKIYDLRKDKIGDNTDRVFNIPIYKGGYRDNIKEENYEFWLDFLSGGSDSQSGISQFNVSNIGRRTKVVSDNNINCIFTKEVPNYIYIEADGDTDEEVKLAIEKGQEVIQVSPDVYRNLTLGGNQNSAFDKIKELIFTHTQYNESVNLSVIPIYHLEPNTRITIHDEETGVHGDYLIKTMNLPLTPNGTSNISATKCIEKTI